MDRTDEDRAAFDIEAVLAQRLRDTDIELALERVRQHAITERFAQRRKQAAMEEAMALGASAQRVADAVADRPS